MPSVDDLTPYERRLTLSALWNHKQNMGKLLGEHHDDAGDEMHELSVMEALDSAAAKLGGDPAATQCGAANH